VTLNGDETRKDQRGKREIKHYCKSTVTVAHNI